MWQGRIQDFAKGGAIAYYGRRWPFSLSILGSKICWLRGGDAIAPIAPPTFIGPCSDGIRFVTAHILSNLRNSKEELKRKNSFF